MKYIKNTARYTPKAAFGLDVLFASIICCATFITSTTPIISTSDVVFIILVIRFIESGTSLFIV